jgi:hypothetical protein
MSRLIPTAGADQHQAPPRRHPVRRTDRAAEATMGGAKRQRCLPGALLTLVLIMSAVSCAHLAQPLPELTTKQWREDLDTFGRELPRRHKNAFHHVSRDSFERSLADLERRLPQLSGDEVYFGLHRLTAIVGDGHTGLFVPTNFHRYPLVLRSFGHDWRVVQAGGEALPLLGGRLVSIGGVPVDEATARVAGILAQDENEWYVRSGTPGWLVVAEALHALGLAADTSHATYAVVDSVGQTVSATLTARPIIARPTTARPQARSATADTALWMRRRPEPLWPAPLGDSCLYVSFRGYAHLARYTGPMWKQVDRQGIRTLIVDLRQNGGGNYITGRRHMVDPAQRRLAAGTLRQVFVLIGNSTFSAAMVNAIDFRSRCHALLVGEPIGERPNSYSERRVTRLPHSRIGVTYSVRWYAFQSDSAPPAVMPDAVVAPTWDDWRAARDPVLEWSLAHRARRL